MKKKRPPPPLPPALTLPPVPRGTGPRFWDYSQYNTVVKQVENVSEALEAIAERVTPLAHPQDRVAQRLIEQLRKTIKQIDRRAIRMLAEYDGAAVTMWKDKTPRDPRRNMFKRGPSWYCEPCAVEVYPNQETGQQRRCPHCGKTKREKR